VVAKTYQFCFHKVKLSILWWQRLKSFGSRRQNYLYCGGKDLPDLVPGGNIIYIVVANTYQFWFQEVKLSIFCGKDLSVLVPGGKIIHIVVAKTCLFWFQEVKLSIYCGGKNLLVLVPGGKIIYILWQKLISISLYPS
jgi:branched-subunit amino acid transport protein AzlD